MRSAASISIRLITASGVAALGIVGLASNPSSAQGNTAQATPKASTVTATLSKASYVNSYAPTTPSTNPDILRTNNDTANNRIKRTYLSFTVSGVPQGATGVLARLSLTTASAAASTAVRAHAANAGSWTAANLTWNTQPGYSSTVLTSVLPSAGTTSTWNVTGALPAAVNGSVDLAMDEASSADPGDITFNGTTVAPIPSLSVTYTCGLNSILAPTCAKQALFGTAPDDTASTVAGMFTAAEGRYHRTAPIWHTYHGASRPVPLTSGDSTGDAERAHANAGQIPLVNWKPADDWSTATGNNTTINTKIITAANNIKAVAPHKVMLSIFHEPENDVGGGAPAGCTLNSGNLATNTPANYRAMWANVENLFAQQQVTNVVWTMIYIPATKWQCLQNAMWPGDSLVDWVGFDSYQLKNGGYQPTWNATVGAFYAWLNNNSATGHNYSSHPYGVFEFGADDVGDASDQQWVYQAYADAKAALDAGTYPNLRAYVVFDDYNLGDKSPINFRTYQRADSMADQDEQTNFNLFANDPLLAPTINNP